MVRVGLDLRADPAHVDVDGPRVAFEVRTPDPVDELTPAEDPARMGGQQRQQGELLRAQVDLPAAPPDAVGDRVELRVDRDAQPARGALARSRDEQRDPAGQLLGADRRRQRVVEALLQRVEPAGDVVRDR